MSWLFPQITEMPGLMRSVAKHSVHHTVIAAWNHQATDGIASTFSGAGNVAKAFSAGELEKLNAKIGQLVVERDCLRKAVLDKRG